MGTKYQVWAWVEGENDHFQYEEYYAGEWLLVALICAFKLKRSGVGCVKIELR